METIIKNCDSCGGDGLYKRYTTITRKNIPYCFKCDGTGKIKVNINKEIKRVFSKIKKYKGIYCGIIYQNGKIIPAPFDGEIPF